MSELSQEQKDRRARVAQLRAAGVQPYADSFARTHSLAQARQLPADTPAVAVAGRVLQLRLLGKLAFLRLADQTGDFQLVLQVDQLGEENFRFWSRHLDLGDFVGARGQTFVTKHGEPSLLATEFQLLTKAISPLPEKFHGLADTEKCYRERYLDLATNRTTLERFLLRSRLIRSLRDFFAAEGFIEVETPVLQTKPCGAVAKPFHTHHNALDIECSLRIAPETYLKRCLIGGFDRVFELARCFRNEGIDPTHLQDFTMLELYAAYENYEFLIQLAQKMFAEICTSVLGRTEIEYAGQRIELGGQWPRLDISTRLQELTGLDVAQATAEQLREQIRIHKLEVPAAANMGPGNLIDALYKKLIREKIVQPTIVTGHPVALSPLARRSDTDPAKVDRFQLVIAGVEVINSFSELTDAEDQAGRFEAQQQAREGGDEEAMEKDDEFVQALSHGMPPAAGWGIGIDRLLALLTDQPNLKDVVLFPLMRPEK